MLTAILLMCPLLVFGQSDSEVIKKSFKVTSDTKEMWFCICNIEGNVEVEAYDGNTIEMELKKTVRASRADDVKLGMDELSIDVSEGENYVKVMMTAPNMEDKTYPEELNCNWNWQRHSEKRYYRYSYDYKVRVPRKISVKISTVNNGDLLIKDVEGEVYANNVNGDVELTNIRENTKAHTVNGHIEVSYSAMPSEFGDFQTVNGDIEIIAPKNGGAVYSFDTQWGEVYSDFEFSKKLAPKVTSNKKNGGTRFKISGSNGYQVGNGGPSMEFETLNGNVRIKKGK